MTTRSVSNVQEGVNSATPGALRPVTFGRKVDSFISNNIYINYELPWETTATVSVINLFDEDPSLSRLEISYDPFIGNPLGRVMELSLHKTF